MAPDRLGSIFLQGIISQLQGVCCAEIRVLAPRSLGMPGAESRLWHEKKWVQFGHGHVEKEEDTQMLPHRA